MSNSCPNCHRPLNVCRVAELKNFPEPDTRVLEVYLRQELAAEMRTCNQLAKVYEKLAKNCRPEPSTECVEMQNLSNSKLHVTSKGRQDLEAALAIAFGGKKAVGYKRLDSLLLFYYWSESHVVDFVLPVDYKEAAEIAWKWLAQGTTVPKEPKPDIDGHVAPGAFSVDAGHFGKLSDEDPYLNADQVLAAVAPQWALYHK